MLSRKVSSECIAKYWLVNLLWTKSCLLIEFDFLRTIYLFHFLKNAYIFFYLLFVAVTIYIGHNWTWCWFRNVSWECSWPSEQNMHIQLQVSRLKIVRPLLHCIWNIQLPTSITKRDDKCLNQLFCFYSFFF